MKWRNGDVREPVGNGAPRELPGGCVMWTVQKIDQHLLSERPIQKGLKHR